MLTPYWLGLHLLIVVITALFVTLGFWQLHRLETRQARNTLLESRLGLEPTPLATLLTDYDIDAPPASDASIAYRPATVTGTYDAEYELLQRSSEGYDGEPGYFVLTPLVLDNDQAVLIKRGWVPFELNTPPVAEASPPAGEVSVQGSVQLGRTPPTGFAANLAPRDPPGELDITAYSDLSRLSEQMPYKLLPVYLELQTQSPTQDAALPRPPQPPTFTDGPHLGYAIQWFAFAVITVVGYGFFVRQGVRTEAKTS